MHALSLHGEDLWGSCLCNLLIFFSLDGFAADTHMCHWGHKTSLSCLLYDLQGEVCCRVASWSSSCQPEYIHLMQTAQ